MTLSPESSYTFFPQDMFFTYFFFFFLQMIHLFLQKFHIVKILFIEFLRSFLHDSFSNDVFTSLDFGIWFLCFIYLFNTIHFLCEFFLHIITLFSFDFSYDFFITMINFFFRMIFFLHYSFVSVCFSRICFWSFFFTFYSLDDVLNTIHLFFFVPSHFIFRWCFIFICLCVFFMLKFFKSFFFPHGFFLVPFYIFPPTC